MLQLLCLNVKTITFFVVSPFLLTNQKEECPLIPLIIPWTSHNSKIIPVTSLLFQNYSHEIGDLLFLKLCRHNRRKPIAGLIKGRDQLLQAAKVLVEPGTVLQRTLNFLYPIECPESSAPPLQDQINTTNQSFGFSGDR